MIFANEAMFFATLFFVFVIVFIIIAAWKKNSVMFLFTAILGFGFTKYVWDTFTVTEAQALFLGLIWCGCIVYGVVLGRW